MNFTILRSNIQNLPFQKYEKDFTFIVDGEKFETSRVIADILSPIIRYYHYSDESINEFTINTKKCCNCFGDFLNLSSLKAIKIDQEHKKAFSEYFLSLGNIYEYVHLNADSFSDITNKNDLSKIQLVSKYSSVMPQEEYQRLIEFFSINFQCLDKENLKVLDADLLEDIIGSKSLQISDEDSLFEFIWELYKEDRSYSKLFEYIVFSNLSDNLYNKFISEVSFNDLNSSIWKSIFITDKERKYITNNDEDSVSEKDVDDNSQSTKKENQSNSEKYVDDNSQSDQLSSDNDSNDSDSEIDYDHPKSARIVFIGDSQVGKTSIVHSIVGESIDDIRPTVSPGSFSANHKDYHLLLWDTASDYRFQSLSQVFYREANVFVIVFDVTNRKSFSSLNEWYEVSKDFEPNADYIIVANKVNSQNRVVTKKEGKKYANDHGFKYAEIGDLTNQDTWCSKFLEKIRKMLKKS